MRHIRFASLLAIALFYAYSAFASVTVTVTGTVTSGTDTSGVFGTAGASLTGKTVTMVFTVNDSTGTPSYTCSTNCTASVSGSSASTSVTINSISYNQTGASASISRVISPVSYEQEVGGSNSAETLFLDVSGAASLSTTNTTPDFNWLTALSDSSTVDSSFSGVGEFSISDGTNNAAGYFSPTSISATSGNCSALSPLTSIDLDIDTTQYPNILGGTDSNNLETRIAATISGASSSGFYPLSLGDYDASTNPSGPNENIDPPAIVASVSSGTGTGHTTYYGLLSSGAINDQVGGELCGTSASQAPVYQYYPVINSGSGVQHDIGVSQVDDTTFTNSSDLSATQVTSFISSQGSFLGTFYFLNTSGPVYSGFWDQNNDGVYHSADDGDPYCSNGSTGCVADGTLASSGTDIGTGITSIATFYGINPKLLVVKLQKEKQLISASSLPSDSTLNFATGCGSSSDFWDQIICAAQTFINKFNADPSEPYFWPVDTSHVNQSVQYAHSSSANCIDNTLTSGCDLVGFEMTNAATYAQYKYTPFVQTTTSGGGVNLFETLWAQYAAAGW